MAAILIQIDAYDPVGAAAVTLRIASENNDTLCHLNSQTWWPALQTAPVFSYDYFDGSFAGSIETPSSSITVSIDPWPNFARYIFGDARVQIWTGTLGAAWGSYTLRFDGQVTAQPEISQGIATIAFKVDDRWLDTPLLTTLLGTGGVEGPAEMLGVPRPLMLGRPRYAPGLMVDSVNNVLMLSGYGLIEDVEVAMEAGARFGASTGDFASYAALIAATIPPGGWGTCKASGLVRHGAPPAGKLSYMVKGDKAGPDGWARLPGQLIRRIALLAGGTGRISDTSLNALDAARPYNVSLVVTEQTTARDLIQKVAASVNAVAGISWTGNLWARPVEIGSSARTLASDGSSLPPVAKVDQVSVAAPFWRLAIEAEKTWSVHAPSEVFYQDPAPGGVNAPEKNATSGGNLIFNGDGEQGDTRGFQVDPSWTNGTFSISTTQKQSGVYSLLLAKAATANILGVEGRAISVKPAEKYLCRIWLYAGAASASGTVFRMHEHAGATAQAFITNSSKASSTDVLPSANLAAGVNYYELTYTVPAGVYLVSPAILNGATGPVALYAEVQMTKVVDWATDVVGTNKPADNATRNVNRGAWSSASVAYVVGDFVNLGPDAYTCSTAHTSSGANGPPGANWTLLTQALTPVAASTTITLTSQTETTAIIKRTIPNAGSLSVLARFRTLTTAGSGTQTYKTEYRVVGAGSWTTLTTVNQAYVAGEIITLNASGTITNSAGFDQAYEIRAVASVSGGSGETVVENRSYVTA